MHQLNSDQWIFSKVTCNEVRMVLCIDGATSYDFKKILKIGFDLSNSADPDELPHYATFHLDLRCLPKYPFRGFHVNKGLHVKRIN